MQFHEHLCRVVVCCVVVTSGCSTSEAPPGAVPREYTAIEAARSADEVLLTYVTALDVAADGSIVVGDWHAGAVVLNPDGSVRTRLNGQGEGPGEFRSVQNASFLPGDSLFIYDTILRRVTVFTPDSLRVAYTTTLASGAAGTPRWAHPVRGGQAILASYRPPVLAGVNSVENTVETDLFRLLNKDGSLLRDSLFVTTADESLVVRAGGGVVSMRHPFGRSTVLQVTSEDRLYLGWNETLDVAVFSLDAERVGGFAKTGRGKRITREEIRVATDSLAQELAEVPIAGMVAAARRELSENSPDRRPVYDRFVVAANGNVWVSFPQEAGGIRWVEYTDTGELVGSVHLASNLEIRQIRDGNAYAVATDSLGVPRVQVLHFKERVQSP